MKKASKKRGRPPKADEDRRRDQPPLRLYVSPIERAAIEAAAEAAGQSVSGWAIAALLRAARRAK